MLKRLYGLYGSRNYFARMTNDSANVCALAVAAELASAFAPDTPDTLPPILCRDSLVLSVVTRM